MNMTCVQRHVRASWQFVLILAICGSAMAAVPVENIMLQGSLIVDRVYRTEQSPAERQAEIKKLFDREKRGNSMTAAMRPPVENGRYLTNHFAVLIDNCNWEIRSHPISGNLLPVEIDAYDGEHRFHFQYLPGSVAVRPAANNAVCTLDDSPVPKNCGASHSGVIWLALASHCYFRTNRPPFMESLEMISKESRHLARRPGEWELFASPPGLPAKAKLPSIRDGYDEFTALAVTNWHGFTYPLVFRFIRYLRTDRDSLAAKEFKIEEHILGFVTNIGTTSVRLFQLSNTVSFVTDERGTNRYLTYLMTNYSVPAAQSDTMVKAKARARHVRTPNRAFASPMSRTNVGFLLFFVLLFLMPPIWLLWARRRGRGKVDNKPTQIDSTV